MAVEANGSAEKPGSVPNDIPLMPWETDGDASGGSDDGLKKLFFDSLGSDEEDPKDEDEAEGDEDEDSEGANPEDDEDPSDEDEDEDSEAESDEDEDEDAEDEDEDGDEEPETIEIDGKEVTLDEVREGLKRGLRLADYTRKTQALAEKGRALDAETSQTRAARDQYIANLQVVEDIIKDLTPKEPDWEALKRKDPAKFAAAHADWQLRQADLEKVQKARQTAEAERNADLKKQFDTHLSEQAEKLLEALPEWKDKKVRKAAKAALADYAKTVYGYTDQDLDQVIDHRIMVILHKASQFDALQGKKKSIRKKAKGKPVLKPGARKRTDAKVKGRSKELARRQGRLARSGSVRDAAAVFEGLLDD